MKQDTERKISLEDLLRLKRAERPPLEFWAKFEADMRAKQLSAIVIPTPSWGGVSRIFGFLSRHQLPFGAAAALALTWVGVHSLRNRSVAVQIPATRTAQQADVAPALKPVQPVVLAQPLAVLPVKMETGARQSVPMVHSVATSTPSHIMQAPAGIAADALGRSPFADGLAVTLSDYRETTPLQVSRHSIFGSDSEFESVAATPVRAVTEPLTRMDPAAERRARLLTPALPVFSSGSARPLTGDWMRDRSSDDRIYESIDRGSSDRMLVGFRF